MSEVEQASLADIPALCELLSVMFTQEREFTPNVEAQAKGLTAIIRNPAIGAILVLREDASILAMVNLLYSVSTALGESVALLEDMVVAPTARRSGMGSHLLAGAISFARAQGCKRITLLTDGDNQAAQQFYQRHGFRPSSMVPMRLPLV